MLVGTYCKKNSFCNQIIIIIKHKVNVKRIGPDLAGIGSKLVQFTRLIAILFPAIKFPGFARVNFGIENIR
jgi:hypothetical protein